MFEPHDVTPISVAPDHLPPHVFVVPFRQHLDWVARREVDARVEALWDECHWGRMSGYGVQRGDLHRWIRIVERLPHGAG